MVRRSLFGTVLWERSSRGERQHPQRTTRRAFWATLSGGPGTIAAETSAGCEVPGFLGPTTILRGGLLNDCSRVRTTKDRTCKDHLVPVPSPRVAGLNAPYQLRGRLLKKADSRICVVIACLCNFCFCFLLSTLYSQRIVPVTSLVFRIIRHKRTRCLTFANTQ